MQEREGVSIVSACRLVIIIFMLLMMTSTDTSSSNLREEEERALQKRESKALNMQLSSDIRLAKPIPGRYAFNVSGNFPGQWNRTGEQYAFRKTHFGLEYNTDGKRLPGNSTLQGEDGLFFLQLFDHGPFREGIHKVEGSIEMTGRDEHSSGDSLSLSLHGLYFLHSGRLTLYGNTHTGRLLIQWKTNDLENQFNITNRYPDLIGASKDGQSYLYVQRSDPLELPTKQCLYRLDVELFDLPEGVNPEISRNPSSKAMINATGILTSRNCNMNTTMTFGGFTMDTNHILRKAQIYTIFVIATTLLQGRTYIDIYRQLSMTNSLPASITTFFFFSAIDLLIAMIHSLASVFFMGLFSIFYIIAFAKFFLFSMLAMRIIAILWVTRSQMDNREGRNPSFLQIQRRFTILFFWMYVAIILTLVALYARMKLGYIMLLIMYSFWIPQVSDDNQ